MEGLYGHSRLLPPNGGSGYTSAELSDCKCYLHCSRRLHFCLPSCWQFELGLIIKVVAGFLEIEPIRVGFFFFFFLSGKSRAVRGTVRRSYPDFHPVRRGALRDSAPCRGTRCALLWRARREGPFVRHQISPVPKAGPDRVSSAGVRGGEIQTLRTGSGFCLHERVPPDSSNQS